jgi:hypothetical protein
MQHAGLLQSIDWNASFYAGDFDLDLLLVLLALARHLDPSEMFQLHNILPHLDDLLLVTVVAPRPNQLLRTHPANRLDESATTVRADTSTCGGRGNDTSGRCLGCCSSGRLPMQRND